MEVPKDLRFLFLVHGGLHVIPTCRADVSYANSLTIIGLRLRSGPHHADRDDDDEDRCEDDEDDEEVVGDSHSLILGRRVG